MRFDGRTRIGVAFGLLVQLALGIWALSRLIPAFAQWQAMGTASLSAHLWLTCLLAWPVIVFFSVLSTLMYGLSSDEALLLAVQPIEPAIRLRALYGVVLWRGVGNWLLFEASLTGIALGFVLGWAALPWLLLLVLGAVCAAWLGLLITLLAVRYVLPHPGQAFLYGLILVAVFGMLALLIQRMHWFVAPFTVSTCAGRVCGGTATGAMTAAPFMDILPLACAAISCLLLFQAWFPLARCVGLLYLATLQQQQGRDGSARAFVWPGLGGLLTLLSRWRTPTGALLVKGLLQQSRHLFAWMRLLVVVGLLALFPLLRPQLLALHLSTMLQVALYATCAAFMALIEYAPYAISSEGARLALYLVAPFDLAAFLRARLCSYLLPALLIGWLTAMLLSIEVSLNFLSLLLALALIGLILIGYVALTVLGSALDADLTQVAEDKMQILMLEELPITPRRLQLLSLTLLVFGAMLLLCWKLPVPAALLVLACLDVLVIVVGGRISRVYLARLGS
jgi:hypothetical protein